ncbi:hypothetical protein KEJ26_07005 [Candidatus Bathyarchaeota archaeon]|nr:hypothetical protein [Candidatus Bathyarchaeota archaeon]
MNVFEKVCKFSGSISLLRNLAMRMVNERLSRAAKYYGYAATDVISCAICISLILAATFFFCLFFVNPLLGIVVSIGIAYLAYLLIINYLPQKLRKEQITISRYASLILDEFYFMLQSTGSVFDALQVVALGDYPLVSKKFTEIIKRVHNGECPESLLLRYANSQPSEALRQGLVELLCAQPLSFTAARDIIELAEREIRGHFLEFTLQLESRIIVLFGIGFFVPLIFSFAIFLLGFVKSPLVFLIVSIHVTLLDVVYNKLMVSEVALLW